MKKYLLLTLTFCISAQIEAQGDSTIYGLARAYPPTRIFLAKMDPTNGIVSNISSTSVATGAQIPNATIDPFNKIYYFIDSSGNITGLSLITGAVVSNHPITNVNASIFSEIIFNCSDSTIYGLARKSSPAAMFLAKMNPFTGVVTNISISSVASGAVIPDATIDPFNKIYYFVDPSLNIVGLSLVSGAVVSSHPMTNINAEFFDQFLFNSEDTTIYGLARKSSPAEVFLAKVDPVTGIVTNISPSSVATGEMIPDVTIDPYNGIFYFVDPSGNLMGLSLQTGAIVSSHMLSNSNANYFDEYIYNSGGSCNKISGIEENELKTIKDIYPVPAFGILNIETLRKDSYLVEMISSDGKLELKKFFENGNNIQLDVSTFRNGLYLLRVSNYKYSEIKKIIIGH